MAKQKTKKRFKRLRTLLAKRWVQLALGMVVAAAVAYAAWYFLKPLFFNPIPANIREEAPFTLYYPDKLPKGYTIDEDSFDFKREDQVVLYKLTAKGKPPIFIACQPKPENFNFDEFTEKKLSNQKAVIAPLGKGILATTDQNKLLSLPTDKGWIIISGKLELEDKPLEELADHFKEAKK